MTLPYMGRREKGNLKLRHTERERENPNFETSIIHMNRTERERKDHTEEMVHNRSDSNSYYHSKLIQYKVNFYIMMIEY